MDTTLEAEQRNPGKKGDARKLRRNGRVPAVYYGPDQAPMSLSVDPEVLVRLFQATGNRNTVVQLKVDGSDYPALVREVQRHPVSRQILHVDFYSPPKDTPIQVMVPVTTVGKPAGAILGGRLRIIRREIEASCLFTQIPSHFEVDVSHMNIDDMVRVSEVQVPSGVELVYDHDFNVVTVYGKRGGPAGEEEEETGEEGSEAEGDSTEEGSSDGAAEESSE